MGTQFPSLMFFDALTLLLMAVSQTVPRFHVSLLSGDSLSLTSCPRFQRIFHLSSHVIYRLICGHATSACLMADNITYEVVAVLTHGRVCKDGVAFRHAALLDTS
jgi:hypothetical protein